MSRLIRNMERFGSPPISGANFAIRAVISPIRSRMGSRTSPSYSARWASNHSLLLFFASPRRKRRAAGVKAIVFSRLGFPVQLLVRDAAPRAGVRQCMMPNLRFASTLVIAAFAAACADSATEPASPFQPAAIEQNPSGSNANAAGFAFFVDTKLTDAPAATNPLLRPTITTTAKLRNVRSEPAVVQFGACNVSLAAYRTADRTGAPVWRSAASQPWEGTYGYGCILPLYEKRLQPGEE